MRECGREYHRFCRDVPVGEGMVARCLKDFRDEVSPRCYGALTSSRRYGDRGWSERKWTDRRYDAPPPKEYRRKTYVEEEEVERQYDQGPDPDLK
jgi:hypothetical protein